MLFEQKAERTNKKPLD